ncbi:MAG: NADH:flavin oxidoreductase [Dehalococcoidia bacterium]|nr:NADH:flavin oxidoreductase [Dehalococcoidia bacterium]MDD5495283.1 NADH:flavin oxidoreductase [Dehalococcoidia bacterium]
MKYERLLTPFTVRKTTFPNRIVFPPVQTNFASADGDVTDRLIRFYRRIAENGIGLTIVGATGISPVSRLGDHAFCLYDESKIGSAARLFDAIQSAGSVPAVQLNHGGRAMSLKLAGGQLVAPSAIAAPASKNVPRELSIEEIDEIIGQFAHTAENAVKAGARMVEFHGTHSFLLNQFLSPLSNQRKDRYGGSTENRARIVAEILEKARALVGDDIVLGLRISAGEYIDGGMTVDECVKMVNMFTEKGLDIVHISAGGRDSGGRMLTEASKGNLIRLAGEVKKKVKIPVIAVGGILRLDQAERALEEGQADMVAIGRALIADPELVTKTLRGREKDVVECNACLQCFVPGPEPGIICAVNDDL